MRLLSTELKTSEDILTFLKNRPLHSWESQYLAHFSTYWNGISTDPRLLLIPVDDHIVHRGDGVFEAFRFTQNKVYLLDAHLDRLRLSAAAIGLAVPWNNDELQSIIQELVIVANEPHLIFRLYVSRGSGGFGTNPYDCPSPQLTIVACRFSPVTEEKYKHGVRIGRSQYIQKPKLYATIKSCNYLPNVLMKKEAVDRNLDFVVAFDENGNLAESSTENIFLIDRNNHLFHPKFDMILRGTTLVRTLDLAREKLGLRVYEQDLTEENLITAQEIFMIGTTLDVLPVSQYENHKVSLGDWGKKLLKLVREDQVFTPGPVVKL